MLHWLLPTPGDYVAAAVWLLLTASDAYEAAGKARTIHGQDIYIDDLLTGRSRSRGARLTPSARPAPLSTSGHRAPASGSSPPIRRSTMKTYEVTRGCHGPHCGCI